MIWIVKELSPQEGVVYRQILDVLPAEAMSIRPSSVLTQLYALAYFGKRKFVDVNVVKISVMTVQAKIETVPDLF